MRKHYDNVAAGKLSELIPSNRFRLVDVLSRKQPHGISEIPVSIDLKKGFGKNLSFAIPWDGELYGFLRNKSLLFENIGADDIVRATINNWDDSFLLVFENKNGDEDPVYSVEKDEVIALLEECMKPQSLV